ncbi:S-layer homology domain-containing protein [Egicoccus halophilus]|uniref:SLH domain-containing protein n=1 Tax=Egicoccus halophilus TaxID=1670830 RepID=A0A8J3AER9_9ACTN|nr:S-layer homology domain-containing protein [Egicoccus halophilus]GGI06564.1 hypothetical protein GCM10011354_19720 [Egicoccus halophilus]
MASYLVRAIEAVIDEELPASDGAFPDQQGHHEVNIDKLAAIGVVEGRTDGTYDPSGVVTRAAMGSFLARSLDYLAERGFHPVPFDVQVSATADEQPSNLRHRLSGQVVDQFDTGYFLADVRFEVHRPTADGWSVVRSGTVVSGPGGELEYSYAGGDVEPGATDAVAACTVAAGEQFAPDAAVCATEDDDGELEPQADRRATLLGVDWGEPVEPTVATPGEYPSEAIAIDADAGVLDVQTLVPDTEFLRFGYLGDNDFQVEGADVTADAFTCAVATTIETDAQHSLSIFLDEDGTGIYALATAADVADC